MKRTHTGYRLHWEGQDCEPEFFATWRDVEIEIRRGAKEGEITIEKARMRAYIISETKWQKEMAERMEA